MALTNNTKLRKVQLTINKKINGSLQTTGGFPKVHSITDAFGAFAAITTGDLAVMTDADYVTRLNGFYDFLEATYSFYSRNDNLNASSGVDAVLCPLDNTAAPTITAIEPPYMAFEPQQGGTLDVNLIWGLTIDQVAPIDVSYQYDIGVYDKNNNLLRTESVYGIIRQGNTSHSSFTDDGHSIYFPEGEDNLYQPLRPEFVPGSIVLNY